MVNAESGVGAKMTIRGVALVLRMIPGVARFKLVYRVLTVEFRLLRQCLFSTKQASSISVYYSDDSTKTWTLR
jgi:hypothetical protein